MSPNLMIEKLRLSDKEFRHISDLVYGHCAINLHDGKRELVRARLAKLIRKGNFNSFSEYMEFLERDTSGKEFSKLIDAMSTNLTGFFRENNHFDYLREKFLPQFINKKMNEGDLRIRVWSAGCSSGEEPYSIAITLLDSIPDPQNWDMKILATDVSKSILKTAYRGMYSEKKVASVPAVGKNKYLIKHRDNEQKFYEVSPILRHVTMFKYMNLAQDWPINGPVDFIFCRNVMIYFDKLTQQRLISRFYNILGSGCPLFTGHSESLTSIVHNFDYIQPTIYMKT